MLPQEDRRDALVLGCGRSGTSLTAGLLAGAGYELGDDLLPADEGGPAGFFERSSVNELNERLLAPHDGTFLHSDGYSRPLRDGERWLAVLPAGTEIHAPGALAEELRAAVPRSPWCLKDPRFGYTLPAWRAALSDPLYVCVFRHPLATATSIARQVRYGDLTVDLMTALELWKAVYTRVLRTHRHDGDWLFVHYEGLLDGPGVERLGEALGARLDAGFADPALARARPPGPPPAGTERLYAQLCAEAGHPA